MVQNETAEVFNAKLAIVSEFRRIAPSGMLIHAFMRGEDRDDWNQGDMDLVYNELVRRNEREKKQRREV